MHSDKKPTNIVKIEKIERLVSPEWERQEGESELWYQRFLLYYLNQQGNRTVKRAVRTWARVNEIEGEARIKAEYREWKLISERNLWLEREIAFEEYQGKLITTQEYDLLERFKNQGIRLTENGMRAAREAVELTGEVFRQYVEKLPRDKNNKINFNKVDVNKYSKIVGAMKVSADTANTMVEIGNKMLALDRVLQHLLSESKVIEASLEEDNG